MLEQVFASITQCNTLSKLDAALVYAKVAPVFPLRPNTKLPLIRGSWKEYATQDESLIRQWWTNYPDANIAWVQGDPILTSDLDVKNGENGWDSYQELNPGDVSAPLQITPSGGYHLIHKFAPNLINFTKKGVQGGIDLRTTNGYIVVAPSYVIDSNPDYTGPYEWLQDGVVEDIPTAVLDQYNTWSTEVTVDRDLDMPESTPWDKLKPLDDLLLRDKHRIFLQTGEINESYENDRSRALLGATIALYQLGLSDEDVLGYLEDSPVAMECAEDHSTERRASVWLWKYTCIKAREKRTPATTQISGEEAFAGINILAQVPEAPGETDRERWVRLAERIDPNNDVDAVKIFREANNISPIFGNQIADIIQEVAGFRKSDLEKAAKKANREVALSMKDTGAMYSRRSGEGLPIGHPVLSPPPQVVESWEQFVGRYVFISTENKWLDRYTRETLSPEGLNAKEAHTIERLAIEGGDDTRLRACEALALRPDTLKVDSRSYWPGVHNDLIHIGRLDAVNTWQPSNLVPVEGDISPWWNLFKHLFPEESSQIRILDWMAHVMQHPHIKINHALLIGGGQRIGKDSIFQPLIYGVGVKNVKNVKAEMLDEKYDDHFIGVKLAILQEIHRDGFRDAKAIENKMKVYLADPPLEMEMRRLGAPSVTQRNLIQILAFTNYRDALHLGAEGDRYLCEWSDAKKLAPKYYKAVYDWYDSDEGYAKVCHYLLNRDISHFEPKAAAPVTKWRDEMADSGKSDLDYQVEDIIDRLRQDNLEARTRRVTADKDGVMVNAANMNLYHEVRYITPRQVLTRLGTNVPVSLKAVTNILATLDIQRLNGSSDHRYRVPRIFVDDQFAEIPGKDRFKGTIKTHLYIVEADDRDMAPELADVRLGLCPPKLINDYLSSL